MTLPPDTIDGAEVYGHEDEEQCSASTVGDAIEEYIEGSEWPSSRDMYGDTVTIVGLARDNQEDDLEAEEANNGDGFPCHVVATVTVNLVEWCRENWPERLEER